MSVRKSASEKTMFLPYQAADIRDTARFQIREKARRIGETYGYAYKYTFKRAAKPGKTYYTANDTGTVLEFIDYCAFFGRFLNSAFEAFDEELIIEEEKILTKVLRFRDGGQIIGLSSNPLGLHGKGGDVIGDEFAYHKQAGTMWEAMQATAKWGDDIVVLSTHTSDASPFNRLCNDAKKLYRLAHDRGIKPRAWVAERWHVTDELHRLALDNGLLPWSYRRTTIQDAVEQGLVEKINSTKGTKYTREDYLKECRASCTTEDQWRRQYLCEPSSDASALLPYNLILGCVSDQALRPVSDCTNLYQGGDFARRGHNTSICTGEQLGDVLWLRDVIRLKGAPWREQLGRIGAIATLPQFRRGAYDQTGMGDMPVEELQRLYGEWRIQGVKFTQQSKVNLANPLRRRFDDRAIRIPNDQALFDSLNKVRAVTTADGRTLFEASDDNDEHADDFWALALLNEAAGQTGGPVAYAAVGARRADGEGGPDAARPYRLASNRREVVL